MVSSGRNSGRRNLGRRPKPRMVLAGGVYWPDEGLFRMLVDYLFENDDAIFAHNPLDEMRRLTLLGFCFKHGILEEYNGSEGMALLYQYRDKLEAAADTAMSGQNVSTKTSSTVTEGDAPTQKAASHRKKRSVEKGKPANGRHEGHDNDKITETMTETSVQSEPNHVKKDDHLIFHDVNTDKTLGVDNKTTGHTDETGTAGHINPHAFEGFAG